METYNSIEVTRQLVKDGKISQEIAETIFPQLKESEDERIRNFLIGKFREIGEVWHEYSTKDIIAWLEKQGSQNLANSAKTCKDGRKPAESSLKDKEMVHYISNAISEPDASAYLKEKNIKVIDAHVWLENLLFEDKTGFPSQWKPSEEQMRCLLNAEGVLRAGFYIAMAQELSSLYNDLKKLKG